MAKMWLMIRKRISKNLFVVVSKAFAKIQGKVAKTKQNIKGKPLYVVLLFSKNESAEISKGNIAEPENYHDSHKYAHLINDKREVSEIK